jgi:hypothetical protein
MLARDHVLVDIYIDLRSGKYLLDSKLPYPSQLEVLRRADAAWKFEWLAPPAKNSVFKDLNYNHVIELNGQRSVAASSLSMSAALKMIEAILRQALGPVVGQNDGQEDTKDAPVVDEVHEIEVDIDDPEWDTEGDNDSSIDGYLGLDTGDTGSGDETE